MAIQFVQNVTSIEGSSSAAASVAMTNGAGNLLVAICGNEITSTISSVTDTNGNTWTGLTQQNGSQHCSRVFYCLGCKGGPNTISFNLSSGGFSFVQLSVAEYSGVGGLDSSNIGFVSGSPCPSVTTSNSSCVVIGLIDDANSFWSGSGNWTLRTPTGAGQSIRTAIVDQVVSVVGTYSPAFSGGAATLEANTLAFFAAAPSAFNPFTQVTGNVINLLPNLPIVKNVVGTVKFQLVVPVRTNGAPTQSGDDELPLPVQLIYDVPLNSDGTFSDTIRSNLGITPAGSYYKVTFMIPGYAAPDQFYSITGTSLNLNTATQVVPTGAS